MQPFTIENRAYSVYTKLPEELNFDPNKNYLFDLNYLSVIEVQGEQAPSFLQGQLTCDLREVTTDTMRHGAQCNLKGRVLSLVDVVMWDTLCLVLPNDLVDDTLLSLQKTAQLSRVQLSQLTPIHVFGLYVQNPADLLPIQMQLPMAPYQTICEDNYFAYHLGHGKYILLLNDYLASTAMNFFSINNQYRGSLAWHFFRLAAKHIEIYPSSRGLFLPHRLELHLQDYIHFNKGCYKGQEIIARTHYRAKLKHELVCFEVSTSKMPMVAEKIYLIEQDTEIGEIIDVCPIDTTRYLLAASFLHEAPKTVRFEHQGDEVLRLLDA